MYAADVLIGGPYIGVTDRELVDEAMISPGLAGALVWPIVYP